VAFRTEIGNLAAFSGPLQILTTLRPTLPRPDSGEPDGKLKQISGFRQETLSLAGHKAPITQMTEVSMRSFILLGAAALTLGTALSTVQAAPLATPLTTPLTTPAPQHAQDTDRGAQRYAEAEDDEGGVMAPLWQMLHREGRHGGDHDGENRRGHHEDDDDDEGGDHGGGAQQMMNPNAPLPQKGIFTNGIRPKVQVN
jgi:hypothetical protein